MPSGFVLIYRASLCPLRAIRSFRCYRYVSYQQKINCYIKYAVRHCSTINISFIRSISSFYFALMFVWIIYKVWIKNLRYIQISIIVIILNWLGNSIHIATYQQKVKYNIEYAVRYCGTINISSFGRYHDFSLMHCLYVFF